MTISELLIKKKGRPLLLKRELDEAVQEHVLKLRDHECPIDTSIIIAVVKGLREVMDCHTKSGPPYLVLPGPNISKYLDSLDNIFQFC